MMQCNKFLGQGLARKEKTTSHRLSDIPANKRVVGGLNAEGSHVVPAETHGDEHDI